jgi:hypothetical protein
MGGGHGPGGPRRAARLVRRGPLPPVRPAAPVRRGRTQPQGVVITLTWTKENSPRWDTDKQRVFGPAELAAVGLVAPAHGAPGQLGHGVGAFILERLEDEAAARGLNYIYNVVPDAHPDGLWIRNWLSTHGFYEASRGQLRRQVSVTSRSAAS